MRQDRDSADLPAADRHFALTSLVMLSGLLVWSLQFGLLYGFNALACARGFATAQVLGLGLVPVTVALVTAACCLLTVVIAVKQLRRRAGDERPGSEFVRITTVLIGALAVLAMIWTGLPAAIVQPC